jgi:hypothetical protein
LPRVWLRCVALPLLSWRLYVMYSSRCRSSASSCHSCTVTWRDISGLVA